MLALSSSEMMALTLPERIDALEAIADAVDKMLSVTYTLKQDGDEPTLEEDIENILRNRGN